MTDVLDAFANGLSQCDAARTGRVLFLNAQYHDFLRDFSDIDYVQWFKPYAARLEREGHDVASYPEKALEGAENAYEAVFVLLPKSTMEGRYLLSLGLTALKTGGYIYVAADNKAGGTRIKGMLEAFGCSIGQEISKHKCRFVKGIATHIDTEAVAKALEDGAMHGVEETGFIAQPGIYGWDKIDAGSALLADHIPADLSGEVADFGCGYGYLSRHVLERCAGIKELYALDADARALEAARENLSGYVHVYYRWADLKDAGDIPAQLDAVIMNPPFHEGKDTDDGIGAAFIRNAAASLKPRGRLYMVANAHLPYEPVLKEAFSSVERLAQDNGFKVFKAVR